MYAIFYHASDHITLNSTEAININMHWLEYHRFKYEELSKKAYNKHHKKINK